MDTNYADEIDNLVVDLEDGAREFFTDMLMDTNDDDEIGNLLVDLDGARGIFTGTLIDYRMPCTASEDDMPNCIQPFRVERVSRLDSSGAARVAGNREVNWPGARR